MPRERINDIIQLFFQITELVIAILAIWAAWKVNTALMQATETLSFTVIWEFVHNGKSNLVQILGIVLLMRALIIISPKPQLTT